LITFFFAVGYWRGFDWWSLSAGVACASGVTIVIYTRDEPPQHVQHWKRGAAGERKTERELRTLERRGWTVEHDVHREGRANFDHVVDGPRAVFLLETKNLSGTIAVEHGVLVARAFDDPDAVHRHQFLAARLGGQAKKLSARRRAETGRGVWVTTVVVIWGHFAAGRVTHNNVTYIHGSKLTSWLLEQAAKRGSAPDLALRATPD
jgi:hypothetical protein